MGTFIKPFETAEELKKRSNTSVQNFDKTKITITKGGKTYNVYDMIQAAREDTEIYPTLEKYGTLKVMETTPNLIYGEIDTAMNLQDLYQQEIKLKELFDSLPAEERNAFDNNYYKFKKDGLSYYEKKAKEEIQKNTTIEDKKGEPQNDTTK